MNRRKRNEQSIPQLSLLPPVNDRAIEEEILTKSLLLVPTQKELDVLRSVSNLQTEIQLCGFGPIAAAANTAKILAESIYEEVILLGIAGTYDESVLPVGSASDFSVVAIDGIGVGEGTSFRSAVQMGFPLEQALSLATLDHRESEANQRALLTVCAASADSNHAAQRNARYGDVIAEDMEGYGVALACKNAGVPLTVVRGISNRVGDRDHANWEIENALRSAVEYMSSRIRENSDLP